MYSHLPSPPLSPSSSSSLSLSDDLSPLSSPLSTGRTLEFTPSFSSITFIDPFSASSKSNLPSTPMSKHKFAQGPQLQQPSPPADFSRAISTRTVRFSIAEDDPLEVERKVWEDAISDAIDNQNGSIDLTNREITHIPPSIVDVTNLVIPPRTSSFRRSQSAPASVLGKSTARAFGRSKTSAIGHLPFVKEEEIEKVFRPSSSTTQAQAFKHELQLYLGGNLITKLPSELFQLCGLTVLSLRANKLTSLPSSIGRLVNLRELNIADNRLTHLPSEILQVPLDNLFLHTNPWLTRPKPSPSEEVSATSPTIGDVGRILSPMTVNFPKGIPTLCEFALRVLISPPYSPHSDELSHVLSATSGSKREMSSLETYYHLPLSSESASIPPDALDTLNRTLPPSLRSKRHSPTTVMFNKPPLSFLKEGNATYDPLSYRCASQHHTSPLSTGRFTLPCEERYEWVDKVGSVLVRGVPDSVVPILWRGCLRGCLDFLPGNEDVIEIQAKVDDGLAKMFSSLNFTPPDDWDDEFGSSDW